MSGGFSNPIVGGGGALVYPSVHSPNFNVANPPASPNPSWAILKTGLAYFFGLIVTGGTITGPNYVINSAGAFFYSGTPAPGNLVATIAGAAGTDTVGNAYLGRGFTSYFVQGGTAFANNYSQNTIQNYSCATGQAGPYVAGNALFETNALQALMLAVDGAGNQSDVIVGAAAVNVQSGNTGTGNSLTLAMSPTGMALTQIIASVVVAQISMSPAGAITITGTAAAPIVISTDTWHSLGSAGATGCTLLQARYTLTPEQFCCIDISLEAGAGGSTAGTYTWSNTLPPAYQSPGSGLRVYPFPFNAPITTATQDSVIVVDEAAGPVPGRVRMTIPAVAANVFFTGTCLVPVT
jgi:hypothetical protein